MNSDEVLIADLNGGDTFDWAGIRSMCMIQVRNGWGCRPLLPDGSWGEHVWFDDGDVVELVERKPQQRKGRDRNEGETHQLGESRNRGWWG